LNELTDEELMVMYQNGNETAFLILYERHASKIFSFLKKRLKKDEAVTDVYQEVFIKIHRAKHLYNKSFPVLPWLFTITKTTMLDELKKDKNFKYADNVDLDLLPAIDTVAPTQPSDLNLFIQKLPDSQKIAVQMRYIDEKTFDEIAVSLKTSSSNVRQILSRGVKRLKELMREGGPS